MSRSGGTAWRRGDCLPEHRRGAQRPSRTPRRARPSCAAARGRRRPGPRPRGEPRRRGRDHPVADHPEVEDGVHPRGPGREECGRRSRRNATVACGTRNQIQCDQTSTWSAAPPPPAGRARAAAAGRQLAEPDRAVDPDRIGHAHPRAQALGIVVGHLVRRDVRPHLQRAHRRRPARASAARPRTAPTARRPRSRSPAGAGCGPGGGRAGRPRRRPPPPTRPRGSRSIHARRGQYRSAPGPLRWAAAGDGGRVDAGRRAIS